MKTHSPRVIFLQHQKDGVNVDAVQVTLSDPTGTYGISSITPNANPYISSTIKVVVPVGTPTTRVGVGQYEYNIDSLNNQIAYEFFFEVIDETGDIQYVYGQIPIVTSEVIGDGPQIPADQIGKGIPAYIDGILDGYKYDFVGDGYYQYFDLNDDGHIDEIDLGRPHHRFKRDPRGVEYGDNSFELVDGYHQGRHHHPEGRAGLGSDNFEHGGRSFSPKPDGIPDVPSPKGSPALTGTFGGTFGYGGTSGEVPATGGARTNRAKIGTGSGYWDGISFRELCTIPIGPRGQCFKDKAHALVRTMLKDTDTTCQAFSDDEVDMFLEGSLWAFNAQPTFTAFMWDHMQERWLDIIAKGATIWALYSQSMIEAGREFTITDNGISYTPPPVSDKMQAYASSLLQHYTEVLKEIKSNMKPLPAGVGIFSVLDVSPSLRRLRHLREKRIF